MRWFWRFDAHGEALLVELAQPGSRISQAERRLAVAWKTDSKNAERQGCFQGESAVSPGRSQQPEHDQVPGTPSFRTEPDQAVACSTAVSRVSTSDRDSFMERTSVMSATIVPANSKSKPSRTTSASASGAGKKTLFGSASQPSDPCAVQLMTIFAFSEPRMSTLPSIARRFLESSATMKSPGGS